MGFIHNFRYGNTEVIAESLPQRFSSEAFGDRVDLIIGEVTDPRSVIESLREKFMRRFVPLQHEHDEVCLAVDGQQVDAAAVAGGDLILPTRRMSSPRMVLSLASHSCRRCSSVKGSQLTSVKSFALTCQSFILIGIILFFLLAANFSVFFRLLPLPRGRAAPQSWPYTSILPEDEAGVNFLFLAARNRKERGIFILCVKHARNASQGLTRSHKVPRRGL